MVAVRFYPTRLWQPGPERVGENMPRIKDNILKCSVFLYPTKEQAYKGERVGGSGVFVGIPVPGKEPGWFDTYVATNAHVIEEGSTFMRINRLDGGFDVIEPGAWIPHPNGDDVAVGGDFSLDQKIHDVECISSDHFLSQEVVKSWCVGPGDETFTVGRFINHEGSEKNLPSVRFGNISMMPYEKVKYGDGYYDAYLVESRSIPGYSGSPVFFQVLPMSWRPCRPKNVSRLDVHGWFLLGLDTGVLPPRPEGKDEFTGMMAVVPIWKLQDVLDLPQIARGRVTRKQTDDAIKEGSVMRQSASGAEYTHGEFVRALKMAFRPDEGETSGEEK